MLEPCYPPESAVRSRRFTNKKATPLKKGRFLPVSMLRISKRKSRALALQRQGIVFQVEAKKAEVNALETSLKSARRGPRPNEGAARHQRRLG